jgi:uncharacterized protein with ParB-like and HNH nuclease domain
MSSIGYERRTVWSLLSNQRYYLDYYQREYKWEKEHVLQLLEDLETRFFNSYSENHDRREVGKYPHYFLGPIIICEKDGKRYIIDGQQRITTLTLILICLNDLQKGKDSEVEGLATLIYSDDYGTKSFNIDVEERREVLDAIYNGKELNIKNIKPSAQNIQTRYDDIQTYFSESSGLNGRPLPYFINWLIKNVDLIEITPPTEEDGYTIFETMNDRGLKLDLYEMLKGYILNNVAEDKRDEASKIWKEQIDRLQAVSEKIGKRGLIEDFFKAWLRSKYATTIRKREANSKNEDFEIIGSAFHRWIRDKRAIIGLVTKDDFFKFLKEFEFFSEIYMNLRKYAAEFNPEFQHVYYNNWWNFTLQFPLILSVINNSDSIEDINKKINIISRYVERLIIFRYINGKRVGYATLSYNIYTLITRIRNLNTQQIEQILKEEYDRSPEDIQNFDNFKLEYSKNKYLIHFLLARMTYFIEQHSDIASNFVDYVSDHFDIEHIISSNYTMHQGKFTDELEFNEYRNRFGDLLLLPYSINRSHQDDSYEDKLDYYFGQNLLAKTLNTKCYEHNRKFLDYKNKYNLLFKPYEHFGKTEIKERQELYRQLINEIWTSENTSISSTSIT